MSTWEIIIIDQLGKFLDGLPDEDRSKVQSIFLLFKEYGQTLPAKYLKRMSSTKELWELRAKRIRIFYEH